MKKFITALGVVILVIAVTWLSNAYLTKAPQANTSQAQETAYERVMRTKTLRCGYFVENPFTIIDPATGAHTGIAADLAAKVAQELGLKLEWTQEVNFATFADDLANGRYDAVCASVFVLPRAGRTDYTRPYAFVPVYGYVKKGDTRFDGAFESIDWSKIKIGGLDGEGATSAARKLLPQAQFEILPQSAQIADMLTAVAAGKTDIGFVLPTVYQDFDKNNPNMLAKANLDRPLYTYGVAFALTMQQPGLKDLLDNVILQLTISGELQKIIDQYDSANMFIRPSVK